MPPKVRSFIRIHFHAALQHGWLPFFKEAAEAPKFDPAYLMAIASRETNMQNIKGDFRGGKYHGFGVMQVDIGTDPAFATSGAWKDARKAIERGTEILASKRAELQHRHANFKSEQDFLWVLAASYNHGSTGSLGDYLQHGSPDLHTTGHDYGHDVVGRFKEFGALLAEQAMTTATAHTTGEKPLSITLEEDEADESESAHAASPGAIVGDRASSGDQLEPSAAAAASQEAAPAQTPASSQTVVLPQAVVEVPQAKPAQDVPDNSLQAKAEKTAAQVKAWYVAIPAAIIQFFVALYKWATDPAHEALVLVLLGSVALIVVVFVVMNFRHSKDKAAREDEAAQRDHELKMQREKQAHELTLLQAKTAASKTENTVRIVPETIQNSDTAP
jgi:hypothetical protein